MPKINISNQLIYLLLYTSIISCIKIPDLYKGEEKPGTGSVDEGAMIESYKYPFEYEVSSPKVKITIKLKSGRNKTDLSAGLPFLKYNKSWLFLLTQDDCVQSAYSHTFAAINGGAISEKYYYNMPHLRLDDLPPDVVYLNKTLGSLDTSGNEVRFGFTTTIAPEWSFMNHCTAVKKGYSKDWYRFYKQSGLNWKNITEMLNFGVGIAFHDINSKHINNADTIVKHLHIAQNITTEKLNGRKCKIMAEPNGNKTYISASLLYDDIRIMTAQAGEETLIPNAGSNLFKKTLYRVFYNSIDDAKKAIKLNLTKSIYEREAIHYGIHNTSKQFAQFLLWLNDNYGKDGDNSVWATSLEEYYEYIYFRDNINIDLFHENDIRNVSFNLPTENHFYFPSLTINLDGINYDDILSIEANDEVNGLSYGRLDKNITSLEIDCRNSLYNQAEYFVLLYEKQRNDRTRNDALYFVRRLKDSDKKDSLLKRIN